MSEKEQIKTMVDQIRSAMTNPTKDLTDKVVSSNVAPELIVTEKQSSKGKSKVDKPSKQKDNHEIVEQIRNFEYSTDSHKEQVRARLDTNTIFILNQLKLSTGIDINRFIAFSVNRLLAETPELKTIIKKSLNNLEL